VVGRGGRRRAAGGAALAVLGTLLGPPSAGAAGVRPACGDIAVSPAFARDRTAMCTRVLTGGGNATLSLYRTRDGGRSWTKAPTSGLSWNPATPFQAQPRFSPEYAVDHRILVATNAGLHVTTDLGATFTIVDAQMTSAGPDGPVLYTGGAGVAAPALGARRTFAVTPGVATARVDLASGLHQPVSGALGGTVQFVVPDPSTPGAPVLAVSTQRLDPTKPTVVRVLWRCTDDLACVERRFAFPPDVIPYRFFRVPIAGHRNVLVALAGHGSGSEAYVSGDEGVTFRRWTTFERLLQPVARYGDVAGLSLASNPALPGRVYARVMGAPDSARWNAAAPPREQLFRSDDGGETWRRVGYQLGPGQRGQRGNLAWNTGTFGVASDPASFALAPDGRLLVPGGVTGESGMAPGSESVYCSTDGGVSWRVLCSR